MRAGIILTRCYWSRRQSDLSFVLLDIFKLLLLNKRVAEVSCLKMATVFWNQGYVDQLVEPLFSESWFKMSFDYCWCFDKWQRFFTRMFLTHFLVSRIPSWTVSPFQSTRKGQKTLSLFNITSDHALVGQNRGIRLAGPDSSRISCIWFLCIT